MSTTHMVLRYKLIDHGFDPFQATPLSACFDLFMPAKLRIKKHQFVTAPLSIAFDIPEGYCLHIYPRSSTFTKHGLLCPTSIIDADYKKGIHLQIYNMRDITVVIEQGARLCQACLAPAYNVQCVKKDFEESDRNGLGSSGI